MDFVFPIKTKSILPQKESAAKEAIIAAIKKLLAICGNIGPDFTQKKLVVANDKTTQIKAEITKYSSESGNMFTENEKNILLAHIAYIKVNGWEKYISVMTAQ